MKKMTMIKTLDYFRNELAVRKMKGSTIQAYMSDLNQFREWLRDISKKPYVDQIDKMDISKYRKYLLDLDYKGTTIDRKYDSLSAFFGYLKDFEIIERNPTEGLNHKRSKEVFSKKENNTRRHLELEQVNRIIECARETENKQSFRDVAILELLKSTGCRRDTVLNLDWSNINFQKEEIVLNHEKTGTVGHIQMSKSLLEALENLYVHQFNADKIGPVFRSQKGNKLSENSFSKMIRKYAINSGVQSEVNFTITSSTFRHSFVTHCLNENIPDEFIVQVTGHKNKNTLNYYAHKSAKNTKTIASLF